MNGSIAKVISLNLWGRVMKKNLAEMSLEELWQLFPIFLTEHQSHWKEWYAEEEKRLRKLLPQTERISHIGSTAIPSIWAKPIIDILVEVPIESDLSVYKESIVHNGYICMAQNKDGISYNKGYTANGFAERVFHLHLRYAGNNNELYFRDYLNEHPQAAKEYEELKLRLWKEYEHNRDGYTEAKGEFVKRCTEQAKILYGRRY